MAHKLIEAAKEAVEVAKCDHDLVLQPSTETTAKAVLDRYFCTKCYATMWVPIPDWKRR